MLYGDGGAGKTTLTIDGLFHLAGARDWIGLEVNRPVRTLMIENEDRAMFRHVIGQKIDSFGDYEAASRLAILSEPWGEFTLSNVWHRAELARGVLETDAEVVAGWDHSRQSGRSAEGRRTRFRRFRRCSSTSERAASRCVWLVHHENKSGDVSGAWERVPDTLVHVQGVGNGHTRIVFRKARWSSEFHGRSIALSWEDGRTFSVVEDVVRDLYAEILDAFRDSDEWRTYKEVATLVRCRPGESKSVLARADTPRRPNVRGRASRSPAERSMLAPQVGHDPESRSRSLEPERWVRILITASSRRPIGQGADAWMSTGGVAEGTGGV